MSSFSFPDWSYFFDKMGASSSSGSGSSSRNPSNDSVPRTTPTEPTAESLIRDLHIPETRESALYVLSRNRAKYANLAALLWHSTGTIFVLLQEIMSIYSVLQSPELVARDSGRVCNALALIQCVASDAETRMNLIKANIPYYLYPFLGVKNQEKPYEFLRLTSLGVVGALVKGGDIDVVHFLLQSEILPLCLRCMEVGNELSKTVATFIVHKIITQEIGLTYICSFAERFFALTRVMGTMVDKLVEEPSDRLLKHIIQCYLRLSDSPRACDGFKICLPAKLREPAVINIVRDDPIALDWLRQLFFNIATGSRTPDLTFKPKFGGGLAG